MMISEKVSWPKYEMLWPLSPKSKEDVITFCRRFLALYFHPSKKICDFGDLNRIQDPGK